MSLIFLSKNVQDWCEHYSMCMLLLININSKKVWHVTTKAWWNINGRWCEYFYLTRQRERPKRIRVSSYFLSLLNRRIPTCLLPILKDCIDRRKLACFVNSTQVLFSFISFFFCQNKWVKHVGNAHFFMVDETFIEYSNRFFFCCFSSARAVLSIKFFFLFSLFLCLVLR